MYILGKGTGDYGACGPWALLSEIPISIACSSSWGSEAGFRSNEGLFDFNHVHPFYLPYQAVD